MRWGGSDRMCDQDKAHDECRVLRRNLSRDGRAEGDPTAQRTVLLASAIVNGPETCPNPGRSGVTTRNRSASAVRWPATSAHPFPAPCTSTNAGRLSTSVTPGGS
jgi:hypothetical protein